MFMMNSYCCGSEVSSLLGFLDKCSVGQVFF